EVDVSRSPTKSKRGGTDADSHRSVSTVRSAMRIGAGDERSRHDQPLFRKVKVEDAVAGCGEVRPLDAMPFGKRVADRHLLLVGFRSREHEVIVGNGRPPRVNDISTRDLVEGVDRKRGGAV